MTNFTTTSIKPSVAPTAPKASAPTRILLRAIRGYQKLTSGRISPCRFYPSCSQYAGEAVETHGAAKGSLFAFRRVLKCRPFGPHGIDLVPLPKQTRSSHS
jgi:putative membrane protein insertion efficiency factor